MAVKRTGIGERIVLTMEGSSVDGGHVRLSDLLSELEALKEALKQTERALFAPEPSTIYYRIVNASHSSPLRMVIEAAAIQPVAPKQEVRQTDRAKAVVRAFTSSVNEIRRRRRPPKIDLPALESYSAMGATLGRSVQTLTIAAEEGKVIPIDTAFKKNAADVIGPDQFALGSISGRMERLNLHNTHRFEIFPAVGPKRIVCHFEKDQLGEVMNGMDQYVTVFGRLRYKQWSKFPHAVDTRKIDIHEIDADLPALHDIRGTAIGATGNLSSEDFVRQVRDEEW